MKYYKYFIIVIICFISLVEGQVWKQIGLPPMNVSKIIVDSVNQRGILFGGGYGGNY